MIGNFSARWAVLILPVLFTAKAFAGGIWCAAYTSYPNIHAALTEGDYLEVVEEAGNLAGVLKSALVSDQVPKEYRTAVRLLLDASRDLSAIESKKEVPVRFAVLSKAFYHFIRADKSEDKWTAYSSPKTGYLWIQAAGDKPHNPYTGLTGDDAGKALPW